MATYSPEILYRKINDVQETFGGLSQTSQFMVSLNLGRSTIRQSGIGPLNRYLTRCGLFQQSKSTEETYDFLCSDASLPGSSFDMAEEAGSRQGILERFPMRRIFADFDLTFYVDREYNTIRIFEEWLNWIDPLSRGSSTYDGDEDGQADFDESNSFFRMRYPNEYKTKVSIIKFERGFWKNPNKDNEEKKLQEQPILVYDFIDAFPMNIAAIPFSYDGSTLTQVTVNFNYARYTVRKQNPRNSNNDSEKRRKIEEQFGSGYQGVSVSNAGAAPPVGYVNGEPYYGPFHKHMKDDGSVVLMVGAEHVNVAHSIIYSTPAASLAAGTITGTSTGSGDSGYSSSSSSSSDSSSSSSDSSSSDSSSSSSDSSSSDSSSSSSDSSSSSSDSSSSSSDSSSSSSDSSSSDSSSSSSDSSSSSSDSSSSSSGSSGSSSSGSYGSGY